MIINETVLRRPWLWLLPGEDEAEAPCGCRLRRDYLGDPAVFLCPKHDPVSQHAAARESLLQRIDEFLVDLLERSYSQAIDGRIDVLRLDLATIFDLKPLPISLQNYVREAPGVRTVGRWQDNGSYVVHTATRPYSLGDYHLLYKRYPDGSEMWRGGAAEEILTGLKDEYLLQIFRTHLANQPKGQK